MGDEGWLQSGDVGLGALEGNYKGRATTGHWQAAACFAFTALPV